MTIETAEAILNRAAKAAEKQSLDNLRAYERGDYQQVKPAEYTKRRPNWCNRCAKDPRLMPEQIPQALPGSSLCGNCQRVEREMRQKLREEQAKKQAGKSGGKSRFEDE